MTAAKGNLVTILVFIAVGCNEYGAWDLLGILTGDILDNSLLARYTFDNSGAPVIDDSGNGFEGTLNGATWVNDGERGGALEFNGTSDYVDLPQITDDAPLVTITAWINLSSVGTVDSIYGAVPFANKNLRFFVSMAGSLSTEIDGNTPATTTTTFTFTTGDIGTWFHVAAVYDSGADTMKLYINGQIEDNANLTQAKNVKLETARLGGQVGPPASWFHGRMDDVRLYSRALSDIEIKGAYSATK